MKTAGPSCSKLTTSLVNVSLIFQKLISQICQYFLLKKCEKLLYYKSFSHFFNKKYQYRCPSLSCPLDRLPRPGGKINWDPVTVYLAPLDSLPPGGQAVPGYLAPHPGYLHPRGVRYPSWFILPPGGEDNPAGISCPPP